MENEDDKSFTFNIDLYTTHPGNSFNWKGKTEGLRQRDAA